MKIQICAFVLLCLLGAACVRESKSTVGRESLKNLAAKARSGSDAAILELVSLSSKKDETYNEVNQLIPKRELDILLINSANAGSSKAQWCLYLLAKEGRIEYSGSEIGLLMSSFKGGELKAGFLYLLISKGDQRAGFSEGDLKHAKKLIKERDAESPQDPFKENFKERDFDVVYQSALVDENFLRSENFSTMAKDIIEFHLNAAKQ